MKDIILSTIANKVEAEIANEVNEMIDDGRFDEMVDAQMKADENWLDKIINIFVKN